MTFERQMLHRSGWLSGMRHCAMNLAYCLMLWEQKRFLLCQSSYKLKETRTFHSQAGWEANWIICCWCYQDTTEQYGEKQSSYGRQTAFAAFFYSIILTAKISVSTNSRVCKTAVNIRCKLRIMYNLFRTVLTVHYIVACKTAEIIDNASVRCIIGYCRCWQSTCTCTCFCPANLSSNHGTYQLEV